VADNLSPTQRSAAMRAVKGRDTKPERVVRELLRSLGEPGYRLHRRDIPGTPDAAYLGRRLAIFVNGCFWHGHDCPAGRRAPQTRATYWQKKIRGNVLRDAASLTLLALSGWRALTVWECETRDLGRLRQRVKRFLARF
jgi:DNA mismatch endonuclease, patch repair protein